jgi:uncharacterized protein (TIGR02300 family)
VANDPTFETGLHAGTLTLVKADLGIKRICPSCGARFYDLQKRPIECPKCAFSFEPEALYKQRRPRQPEPAPAAVVRVREEDEETEDEDDETEEAEVEEAEEIVDEAPLVAGDDEDETVEAEATEADAGMSVVEPDAEVADIEDIDEDVVDEDEDDDGLLETVEEDEDDVSGIIDTDLGKDEP